MIAASAAPSVTPWSDPNRFLYGSDWPLAPMTWYRRFVAAAIPEEFHPLIFEENARQLLRI